MNADPGPDFQSGFAVLLGRPNVGKSTLMNRLIGRKVAITSDKPQTTRNRIAGVLHRPGFQIVFVDTPGIHRPRHRLGEHLVRVTEASLKGVDAVLLVVEADRKGPGPGDRRAAAMPAESPVPVVLVVNKVDLLSAPEAEEVVADYASLGDFRAVCPVSALSGEGLERLVEVLREFLPSGPAYFPEGMISDQTERVLAAEIVREKIMLLTREEVPHSVAVQTERMEEREDGLLDLAVSVFVERDSQKGIIIGRGGQTLREIGRLAREELEGIFGTRIYLDLWVKVKEGWRNRENALHSLGYRLE